MLGQQLRMLNRKTIKQCNISNHARDKENVLASKTKNGDRARKLNKKKVLLHHKAHQLTPICLVFHKILSY